ncbi:MAG: hypothetical protein Q8K99_06750, partial [Actinomycetota bacterium]|nr:hypothetical protein [Actinomycetota bacterium]
MTDSTRLPPEPWLDLLPQDPRPWILDTAEEPAARWLALTHLLDLPDSGPDVVAAHEAVCADPGTQALLDRLVPWDIDAKATGHDKPEYTPNLLSLLADMGVRASDDSRIERILAAMLEHADAEGRFQSFGRWRAMDAPVWGALACDAHAIAETLARFGYADDPRTVRAFDRIAQDMTDTAQGRAWPCRVDPVIGFRGPGRKSDFCPQVALEALRAFSYLPAERRPHEVVEAGRVSLRAWRERGSERPYMFGHGRNFKRVKWPVTWYGALELVDVMGRYPELWNDADSSEAEHPYHFKPNTVTVEAERLERDDAIVR